MSADALIQSLMPLLDDAEITRAERRTALALVAQTNLRPAERLHVHSELFDAVVGRLEEKDRPLVRALGDLLRAVHAPEPVEQVRAPITRFGPEDPMVETLLDLLHTCHATLDVAVFTLTDDRLAEAVMGLHRKGVKVRLLTDGNKSYDQGSDVDRLHDAGVPTYFDDSPHHFHHKFAVIDRQCLVTGSYNWTRGAAMDNRENYLVSWDHALVEPYQRAFDALWSRYAHA